jgi:hypothetical protein
MVNAEVTIDGKKLTDTQVMVLRIVVQGMLLTAEQNRTTLNDSMAVELHKINRMLCGEE